MAMELDPGCSAAGNTLTITALGDQIVPNNAYSGPSASTASIQRRRPSRATMASARPRELSLSSAADGSTSSPHRRNLERPQHYRHTCPQACPIAAIAARMAGNMAAQRHNAANW